MNPFVGDPAADRHDSQTASASLLAFRESFICLNFRSRFQHWELRIRPIGGNITENPMFVSKIMNSGVQRSNIRKIVPAICFADFQTFIKFNSLTWIGEFRPGNKTV